MFSGLPTIFHVAEIWLANRYGARKPDWLNSPRLKTPLGEIAISRNPFGAIFHVAKIWLANRYGASEPDWLNSPEVKTPLDEFSIFDNVWFDDVQTIIDVGKSFLKNRCSFDPRQTNRQTDKRIFFIWLSLQSREWLQNTIWNFENLTMDSNSPYPIAFNQNLWKIRISSVSTTSEEKIQLKIRKLTIDSDFPTPITHGPTKFQA